MRPILVAGALHLDVIVEAPRLPLPDETLAGRAVAYRFGGKGGNQAVAAARMGARVAMAGRVGQDDFAAPILAALDAAGVDRAQVRQVPGASGMSVAIVEDGGSYGAVIVSGVNLTIDPGEITLPAEPCLLLLQNEIPEPVNRALAARAGPGTQVILNAAPARAVAPDLLARCDLVVVNRVEAAQLTGADPEALNPAAAAARLLAQGPRAVIVTLGGAGLVARTAAGAGFALPAHRVPVVSTHGAGDAFLGALAAALAGGAALEPAARLATATAALHVSRPPDARAAITPAEVRALTAASGS
jgi:ribokinase